MEMMTTPVHPGGLPYKNGGASWKFSKNTLKDTCLMGVAQIDYYP